MSFTLEGSSGMGTLVSRSVVCARVFDGMLPFNIDIENKRRPTKKFQKKDLHEKAGHLRLVV